MPVKACSEDGKPGFKFGDSGFCYTYEQGNDASRERAKSKAANQERAARASGWQEKFDSDNRNIKENKMQIQIPYDNADEIKKQHDSMSVWHRTMADSHAKAAGWHSEQSDLLSKAMNEVPLDPEKVSTTTVASRGSTTGEPPSGKTPAKQVPLDPMKKAEFIQILKDHADLFGDLGASIEEVADKILGQ